MMLAYSAKNSKAKDMEEYSTLYPDTNSDSPSVKSNGALFVSATSETINIIEQGNKANVRKELLLWNQDILLSSNEPTHITTESNISPIQTS